MSSRGQETAFGKRTSERMRLKMLRNLDEYKILNPYRQPHSTLLPEDMQRQLKKMTHLSSTSIRMLSFHNPKAQHLHSEVDLHKMQLAH